MSKKRKWKSTPPPSLEKQVNYLMDDVCRGLGFCDLPRDYWDRVFQTKSLEASQFTRDVLLAEGFAPDPESEWFKAIESRFRARFGGSITFEDDERPPRSRRLTYPLPCAVSLASRNT